MQTTETTVLVVGAGPVGLALTAELTRLGIATALVDRQGEGANTSRAAVIHARTLEVLEPLGVVPRLLDEGVKVPVFRVRDRDRELVSVDFAQIASRYAYTLMCPQDRTEQHLLAKLHQLGASVHRPLNFEGLQQDTQAVVASLRGPQGQQAVRAQYIVGCDGMHSAVREQAGIGFEGAAYGQCFVLADVHMDWPLSREEVSLFFSPQGLVVVAPLPHGRFRIVATVDDAPAQPSAALVQALLDQRGPQSSQAGVRDVVWSSRFHVHHRVAASMHAGRVLLCGDAAHVHSPAGGQGMNTGIQDAISLAHALHSTLREGESDQLQRWAHARRRVAQDVVAFTDRMTRLATLRPGVGPSLRNALLSFAGRLPPVRAAIASRLAELSTR